MAKISNSDLKKKIDTVNDYITNNHDVTSFIYFKVNNFELDTRSSDSFKHYALSLENVKTGVGQGNQFTLTIAFHQDFTHLKTKDNNNIDINEFEAALSTLVTSSMILGSNASIDELKRNKCVLKYGYLSNNRTLETEEYEGMLLQYTVKANQQIVQYTLKGYSGEKATIGTVNWYPHVKYAEAEGGKVVAELVRKKEAQGLTPEETNLLIKELNQQYTGPLTFNPYKALQIFIADYNEDLKQFAEQNGISEVTEFVVVNDAGESRTNNLRAVNLSLCRNQTPLDYVEYLVSMFVEETKDYALQYMKQQLDIVDRWVYEIRRKNNKIEIHIDVISSDSKDAVYEFQGYTPNNRLLIDYELNYDGTVALTVADTMGGTKESENNNTIFINSRGLLTAEPSITKDMFVAGSIDLVRVQKQNTWLDRMSCANSCKMTTFGLPFEIPVSTVFKVSLYINGSPHHTSGRCYVTGITDRISNGRFTTEFQMIRLPGKSEDVDLRI